MIVLVETEILLPGVVMKIALVVVQRYPRLKDEYHSLGLEIVTVADIQQFIRDLNSGSIIYLQCPRPCRKEFDGERSVVGGQCIPARSVGDHLYGSVVLAAHLIHHSKGENMGPRFQYGDETHIAALIHQSADIGFQSVCQHLGGCIAIGGIGKIE